MKKYICYSVLAISLSLIGATTYAQSDRKNECACDTLVTNYFLVSEFNPEPSISSSQFEEILNKSIVISNGVEVNGKTFYISFVINCEGKACAYEAMRPTDATIERVITSCLKDNVQWTVGYVGFGKGEKKPVDFSRTVGVKFELGKGFKLSSPLEFSELNGKKKKK